MSFRSRVISSARRATKLFHKRLNRLRALERVAGVTPPHLLVTSMLLLTGVLTYTSYSRSQAENLQRFDLFVREMKHSIELHLQIQRSALIHARSILNVSRDITRDEFHAYVGLLEPKENYPGIQGIGFAQLQLGEIAEPGGPRPLEGASQKAQRIGFESRSSETHPSGSRIEPIGPFSAVYLESFESKSNDAFDLNSLNDIRLVDALDKARATEAPSLSPKIRLRDGAKSKHPYGFLIFVPVFQSSPSRQESSERSIRGFVFSPFHAADFFERTVGRLSRERFIAMNVYEGPRPDPARSLYQSESSELKPGSDRMSQLFEVRLAGKKWTIEAWSLPGFAPPSSERSPWYVFFGGLIASGMAFRMSRSANMHSRDIGKRERPLRLANERLPDIHEDGQVAGVALLGSDFTDQKQYREQLTDEKRMLELVNDIGLSLRWEHDIGRLIERVTKISTKLIYANWGVFYFAQRSDATFNLEASSGLASEVAAKLPSPRGNKEFAPVFRGEAPIRIDDFTQDSVFRENPRYFGLCDDLLEGKSYLAVPVISRTGEVIGAMVFCHRNAGRFSERTVQVVEGIAAQAAVAIDNARLYEALKSSEEQANLFAASRSFMAEAARVLASSFDPNTNLQNVVKLAVPRIADFCSIELVDTEFSPRQFVSSSDPAFRIDEIAPALASFNESATEPVLIESCASDPENGKTVSVIGAPVRLREQYFGILKLANTSQRPRLNQDDVKLSEELADRIATSIENAKLYFESQSVNRSKDEFLATLSHELRTPLNVIQGHAELLKAEEGLSPDVMESIHVIHRNAQTQTQIINDLLDVSSIITGKIAHFPIQMDLTDVVRSSVESVRFPAEAKDISIHKRIEAEQLYVRGDPTRLQQVIWNLLSNAVKFTPHGGSIHIHAHRERCEAVVSVRDTGPGIDPDFIPHAFERFRQEDNTMTRRFGGLGLGLSIVRSLTELHGGTVSATSPGRGQGSTFTVRFPCLSPNLVKPVAPQETKTSENVRKGLSGKSVLIVDDEPDSRKLLARYIERTGANSILAASAREGFELFLNRHPDVIVSDISMPGEDGFSFLKRVREHEAQNGAFTPAIALTAFAREEDKHRSRAAGYQTHLAKPVTGQGFRKAVTDIVSLYESPHESRGEISSERHEPPI